MARPCLLSAVLMLLLCASGLRAQTLFSGVEFSISLGPFPGQLNRAEQWPAVPLENQSNPKSVIHVMRDFVQANKEIRLEIHSNRHLEEVINSPLEEVNRAEKYQWFKGNEAGPFLAYFLRNFFLDSHQRSLLEPEYIEELVDEADVCEDRAIFKEFEPEINMNNDGRSGSVLVRFFVVSCANRRRFEMVTYKALRRWRLTDDKHLVHLRDIQSYLRSWLIDDMVKFFFGESKTCKA